MNYHPQNYFDDVCGVIFVFDTTNSESFQRVPFWWTEVQNRLVSLAENFEILVVRNKTDLVKLPPFVICIST